MTKLTAKTRVVDCGEGIRGFNGYVEIENRSKQGLGIFRDRQYCTFTRTTETDALLDAKELSKDIKQINQGVTYV